VTGTLIAPVIPSTAAAASRPARAHAAARMLPLTVPPARPPALGRDVVYGLARVDRSGRVADRAVTGALGWRGGDRLTLTAEAGVVVIVDISNTFNADATGLVTPHGTSGAQEIARAAPASASVVKAFNTVFGHVLAEGRPLDVLIAGDDARAKASVSAFIESLGLRPLDTGDLAMAHWLEGAGLLMMGLASHGVGFNFDLGVNVSG
jgi:hypothetical protein